MTPPLLHGLPPIIDAGARILILGSFPSVASLEAGHYYAHSRNQFWRVLAQVLERPLLSMDYEDVQAAVRQAGFAVWDVYGRCRRQGSLDTAIRDAQANDFRRLKALAPSLTRVCFNGTTAGKFAPQLAALGYETRLLPSTSPAYTLSFERKLALWKDALQPTLAAENFPGGLSTSCGDTG
ncbi:DNA-deoxyinosine glycosylase [Denitratisoma sp. DHT3]|uniref:DNA-deoxyinosine glycosylase n=1 Tax=Denitratisoma sp. DHT3 TaxID=1981880 RepID=UPI001198C9BA|nr:DNA-deoxyinosine glycosylase [Denitratisoma sp. DHT3]QDX80488.1 DNA-deoxyinosine glycosylase [Denitratisoma sp. DHT3]